VGYAGQKAVDHLIEKFSGTLIKACVDHRSHSYFRQLANELGGPADSVERASRIAAALERVINSEGERETVHEYYRRSVLSRSRDAGPRLLALLSATLINECRVPDVVEHQLAEIAETCTDAELAEFTRYYAKLAFDAQVQLQKDSYEREVRIVRDGYEVMLDYESGFGQSRVGPLTLYNKVGPWAPRFERAGAIEQSVEFVVSREDSDMRESKGKNRHEIFWTLNISKTCERLAGMLALLKVSAGAADPG
jgi:hypothetical protein